MKIISTGSKDVVEMENKRIKSSNLSLVIYLFHRQFLVSSLFHVVPLLNLMGMKSLSSLCYATAWFFKGQNSMDFWEVLLI